VEATGSGGGVGGMGWRIRAPSQQFHQPGGWEPGCRRDARTGSMAMKALKKVSPWSL